MENSRPRHVCIVVFGRPDLLLRKNEIRAFSKKVKYGAEYGVTLHQKYGEMLQNLYQIRGRIVFVSGVK